MRIPLTSKVRTTAFVGVHVPRFFPPGCSALLFIIELMYKMFLRLLDARLVVAISALGVPSHIQRAFMEQLLIDRPKVRIGKTVKTQDKDHNFS